MNGLLKYHSRLTKRALISVDTTRIGSDEKDTHAKASDQNDSLMTIKPAAIQAPGEYCNAWKTANLASNLIPGVLGNVPMLAPSVAIQLS